MWKFKSLNLHLLTNGMHCNSKTVNNQKYRGIILINSCSVNAYFSVLKLNLNLFHKKNTVNTLVLSNLLSSRMFDVINTFPLFHICISILLYTKLAFLSSGQDLSLSSWLDNRGLLQKLPLCPLLYHCADCRTLCTVQV